MYIQLIVLTCFIAFPYLMVALRDLMGDIYLWQVKEYRWDRVWSQLRYEKDKAVHSELLTMLKIALLTFVVAFTLVPEEAVLAIAMVIAFCLYWYQSLEFMQRTVKRKILRPHLKSLRNMIIAVINLIIILLPFVMLLVWLGSLSYYAGLNTVEQTLLSSKATFNEVVSAFIPRDVNGVIVMRAEYIVVSLVTMAGLAVDLIEPLFVALAVLLTSPLAILKRKLIIRQASRKMAKLKETKVIAVTGSYGKSTTKELLYQILRMRFNTVKTEKNNNTDLGIALTVLKKLSPKTEVFIAEMGAYKIGETSDCCKVAQPDIAIITGVDQQHVSLFGGIKEVLASTYEVVEEMQPQGLAILNGDNEYCLKIAEKTSKRKMLYFSVHNASKVEASELTFTDDEEVIGHKVSFPGNENVFVKDIRTSEKGLLFKLNFAGQEYNVKTNLKATYNISNLMAAVLSCIELGMTMEEIVEIINHLEFSVPYLNMHEGLNEAGILDDGYNANPTGFISALKYLKSLNIKQKKWIFTQGLIELGPERVSTNKKMAEEIITSADALYTTDSSLYEQVKKLAPEFETKLVRSVFDFPAYYESYVKKGHVVLIEGSFPQEVLKKIYKDYYH